MKPPRAEASSSLSPEGVFEICEDNGLLLSDVKIKQLLAFERLLCELNRGLNLVSRKDADIWGSHILHSLSILFHVRIPLAISILDIGTGGGFPGIPLAIALTESRFFLVESIQKKSRALRELVGWLGLKNVQVINSRVEDLPRAQYQRSIDLVIARAVAPLAQLLEWTRGLYRIGGGARLLANGIEIPTPVIVAWKGGDLTNEKKSAQERHPRIKINEISLDFRGIERTRLEEKKLVLVNNI
jgi:16S rRNA (guanine527-N7)-methyltransferase